MSIVTCQCGAQYTFPERLAGKRVKCKNCQRAIQLPDVEPAEVAAEVTEEESGVWSALAAEASSAASRAAERQERQRAEAQRRAAMAEEADEMRGAPSGGAIGSMAQHWSAYIKDVGGSCLLITNPGNLANIITLCVMGAVQSLLSFAACLGLVGSIIVNGWLCAYYFNIVLHAAGGEKDLPDMNFFDGWIDGIIFPLLKFIGVSALCMLPLICYAILIMGGIGPTLDNPDEMVLLFVILGGLMFPMIMLMAAVGGLGALMHPVLILRTIFVTAVPYLVTCALVCGALIGSSLAADAVHSHQAGKNPFGASVLVSVASVYGMVVAMRMIGLYYHHFKHRFSWSWG